MKVWIPALFSMVALAQVPSFEVAAIRPHEGAVTQTGVRISGTQVELMALTLRGMLTYAYLLEPYQVEGGEGWTRDMRFDVTAKAPGDVEVTHPQVRQMVQKLLADRFGLKLQRVTRELPVYALVVAKGGHKLKENPDGPGGMRMRSRGNEYALTLLGATVDSLAKQLTPGEIVDLPVIDKTGLTGKYDGELKAMIGPSATGPDGESIFTAFEEQLGLKLEKTKAPMEIFVIEKAERPSEN
jgi:uncharacterized protein (TIGR03435 family)